MELDFNLEVFNETEHDLAEYSSSVEDLLSYTLGQEGITGYVEACIVYVNNQKIQEINRDYRGKDQITDVISFAMEDTVDGEPVIIGDGIPRILGDIYLSIDKCTEQAKDYGHSFKRELHFLVLHGFLHLLGYDHLTLEDEKAMFSKQEEILNAREIKR